MQSNTNTDHVCRDAALDAQSFPHVVDRKSPVPASPHSSLHLCAEGDGVFNLEMMFGTMPANDQGISRG
jgi:hypothetical protein